MARARITALTAADVEFIRELAREVYAREVGGADYARPDPPPQAPDVYVARTPEGGISALVVETGTGADVGGDTGTGYDEAYMPGSADCTIYRLEDINDVKELVSMGFEATVYNLMPIDVAEEVFVVVTRDKNGEWYIPNPGLPFTNC